MFIVMEEIGSLGLRVPAPKLTVLPTAGSVSRSTARTVRAKDGK